MYQENLSATFLHSSISFLPAWKGVGWKASSGQQQKQAKSNGTSFIECRAFPLPLSDDKQHFLLVPKMIFLWTLKEF